MDFIQEISDYMQKGRAPKVEELTAQALENGIEPRRILDDALLGGMAVIGEKFKRNEIFVPQVLLAARAMNMGIALLRPHLIGAGSINRGTVIIGTVEGDLHDIGKNIVKMMLEGKEMRVIDLGVNVPAGAFVAAAQEHNASIICCSALLTSTMNRMKDVVDLAVSTGIRERVKIMIGGAPITQGFCESIGADYYTPNATACAETAEKICNDKNV